MKARVVEILRDLLGRDDPLAETRASTRTLGKKVVTDAPAGKRRRYRLNLMGPWSGILTGKTIREGSFNGVHTLVRHITIEERNESPPLFVWTEKPMDITRKGLRHARWRRHSCGAGGTRQPALQLAGPPPQSSALGSPWT